MSFTCLACFILRLFASSRFLQKLSPTEIQKDMLAVLGENAPSYQVIKNMCGEFKLSRQMCKHAKGPVTVSTKENADTVHDMVMDD